MTVSASTLTVGGAIGGGAHSLTKAGAGTLLLSGTNTFTSGTTLSAGTLDINNAAAVGTGTFTINGGTIDNTSAGAITLSNNNTQTWGGSFTFTGTKNLNLGTGAVSLSGTETVTTTAGTLTVGGVISDGSNGYGITKAGSGTLLLNGADTYSGTTTISAGVVQLGNASAAQDSTVSVGVANGLAFSASIGSFTIGGLAGGSNEALTDVGASAVTLTVGNNGTTNTYSGILSGTGGVLKINGGTQVLSGANTYTGGTTLTSGTLDINNATAIGTGAFTINGGTIDNTTAGLITLSNNNTQTWGGSFTFTGTQALNLGTGAVTLSANPTVTVSASTLTVGGVIGGGAHSLTKAGSGTLLLSGTNTFTSGTTLSAGTLDINNAAAIGTGTFTINGGTIDNTTSGSITLSNNNTQTWGGSFTFTGTQALNLGTGAVTLSGNPTVTVSASTLTVGGVISGSGISLTKAGAGTLLLSGTNTFTGGTTLSAGTLDINNAAAIGTGTFTINGGTIDNTTSGSITLSNNNTQTWGGSFTFTGTQALNLGTGAVTLSANPTVTVSANTLTVGGAIGGGAHSITKAGSGTLTVTGSNTYSSGTTISAGTLLANDASGSGTGSGSVTVDSGATLGGTGTASGAVTVNSGGNLSPGSGGTSIFTTGILVLSSGSDLNIALNGNTAGSGYDQVNVTGTVTVTGCTLNLSGSRSAADGSVLEIIANDGADAVTGTFQGLSEGATVAYNGVTYGVTYIGGTGNDVALTASTPSKVVFSVQPSNLTAGVADSPSIVVDVEDQFGNIVTSDSSNVTLSVASGGGSVTGTVTVAASSGVATFSNIILDTARAHTLLASDGSLTTATSSSFTVSAAAASQVAFAQEPTNVTAGSSISPAVTVDVEDQFGNLVTTDSSDVTVAIHSGPGSLNGTLTEAASGGVATFSNLSIDTSGSYTLAATDGSLTSGTSSSFTVNPTSASKVVFAQQPSNVTAGNANSPSITVDVEDQYGNIVTGDSSNVTLSIHSGPGSIGGTDTVAASSGVATFSNVIIDTAGSYTLAAADGSLTGANSNSFTVSHATASQLAFNQQPTTVTAGVAISPSMTVDVEDAFGNIVTSDTSNVTLAVHSGGGSVSGTATVAAASGVATFSNVIIDTAGTHTLQASDGSLTVVNSSSFTVNPAAASQVAFNQQPTNVTAGVAISPSITVDVEDQFGNVVTSDSSSVTLSIHSGPGAIGGTDTVAASSGVATFSNVKLNTVGSYTLAAADGSLTGANSSSFTVSSAAASQVAFNQQPTNVTAGVAISPSITVDVEDQFGNVVTSDSSSVTLSIHTGPGSIGGTDTVAASSGVATFSNVKLDTAGSYTLAAADGSLTVADSSSYTVSPAAASQLAFNQQPTNVTAGVAISPSITVDVEDQFGNVVTGDSSNVTLSINTGPGSIGGTDTVAASSGVATFSNVKLDTAGSYTLAAADGSLTAADSSSFTVSPAAASQVVFNQEPTNVTAGVAISPSITVDVEDQFGNIVTGDSSNVTLSVNTGPGSVGGTDTVAASSGVATFGNVKLDTAGSYTLAASDGSLTGSNSSSFTVSPAAASQVVFNQQPSTVTAGVAISPPITVDVEDQFGNIVASDSSNVTLSVNTGPGLISGTDTVAASSGVATFSNVKLDTAGSYTLAASDGSLTVADSNSFTVNPAAASQLAFNQQPTNVTAGVAISPSITVDVEDQYGNIVTSDSSSVALSVNTGPGSIGGTDTVAASSGVATFGNVKLDTAGSYTLAAADGSLTAADSSSFTVSPAAASQVVFNQQPTNVTAGVVISPSITVDVEDQFGNVVTGDSSSVTLSTHTGPGSIGGTDTVAASSGVATFSNVKLDTVGSYTFAAADGSLTVADSSSFTVSPAAASQVAFNQQPTNVTAGVAISPSITVDVEDQFGNVVTGDSSSVTLSIHSGPGSIGGTDTLAASSGVATFSNVKLNTAGSYTLAASDGSLTGADSSSFTVNPAAASQLAFNQQPTNVTAGVAISPSITVDVEDQFGNIVTSDSSSVTLSINTGPGSIGGTDMVAASSGVATFGNVKLDTAGSYTLAAADGSLTGANSSSFTVNPAAASQVVFNQQPTNVTAGVAIGPSITVDVEDQYGNIVTTDSSNVVLSIHTGPGSIGGTDSVAASSGVATFSNVKLDTAGSYTLAASDGSLTGANSNSFTVNPAAASQLAFNQQPTNVTAGVAISPSITVDVEDQYGNIATSDSSNVVLSIHTGPGSIGGTDTVAASSGVATFSNVKLDTAGSYTLAASDGSLTVADSNSFTVNPAAASQLAFNQQPTNVTAGVAISPSITVDVEDQFGNIVTGDSSNVTLSINTGPGSIGGTDTVAASSGVATFGNVKLDTAGSYTLAAADGSLTAADSSSFTVNPAAASQVAFNQQPTNVTAGVAISPSITVDVEDQFGNVVTGDSSNVTLSVNSGSGSVGGTDTVAASSGVATFSNVKLDTAGSYTLAAADGSLTVADSSSFTVSPAAASQLAFNQQPTNVTAGVAISPSITVDVEDQFGNIVTGDSSNVTLSINTGPGSIGGTDTVAASSGVATFNNVKLDTAGSYTLAASDGSLTVADSNSFTVDPAAASQLAFNQQPTDVTAGVAISPSITVDVEDQFGNVVTGDSSSVTLSVNTGPGSIGGTDTVAASSGVATFSNVKLDTVGSYTLAAADGSLTVADSSSFTVSPAAASQVVFNQQPSNVTAGVAMSPSITVDVEDQFGNIVTSDSSNVTLSIHTGPGSIGGTDTLAASSGVATFSNVKLNTAGSYTLAASDGSLTGADSSSFTVSPAAASQVVFDQEPTNVTAGVAISPSITVDVEDQYGNIVTGDSSNVTLSINTGPGAIGGTDTVAASSGVATFSSVKLDTAGSYTLAASDGSLTVADSSSFTVSPAAASQLAFNQQPTDVTAGVAISPSITIDVEDQYGNIVTGDSSSVTLSVNTGPGSIGGTDTIAASSGVATFNNVKLDMAGSYTLSAADGSLTGSNSSSFTVSPAAASQVVFNQQPSDVTAGVAISPSITVDVEDQFGNIVTGDSSSVTLSIHTGPALSEAPIASPHRAAWPPLAT